MNKIHSIEGFSEVILGNGFLDDIFIDCFFFTEIMNADFTNAIFGHTKFRGCGISHSDFLESFFSSNSTIERSNFHMCNFKDSDFEDLTVCNSTFDGCSFRNVEIGERTVFENVFFTDCVFSGICIPENRTFLDIFRNCNFESCGEF